MQAKLVKHQSLIGPGMIASADILMYRLELFVLSPASIQTATVCFVLRTLLRWNITMLRI